MQTLQEHDVSSQLPPQSPSRTTEALAQSFAVPATMMAPVEFVPLTDSQGVLLLIPAAVLAHYRCLGMKTLHFEVSLDDTTAHKDWFTVTEAAREHLQDVDGMTLAQATAKISRACDRQKILASGHGRDRRIEPTSFSAWRLAQRERELDRADKEFS